MCILLYILKPWYDSEEFPFDSLPNLECMYVCLQGAKGDKGDAGRMTMTDGNSFPTGFIEGPPGPPGPPGRSGKKVS